MRVMCLFYRQIEAPYGGLLGMRRIGTPGRDPLNGSDEALGSFAQPWPKRRTPLISTGRKECGKSDSRSFIQTQAVTAHRIVVVGH